MIGDRSCRCSFLFLLMLALLLTSSADARPRVAVLEFTNPGGFDSSYPIGEGMSYLLRKRLMDAGKVQVVDRADLESLKTELRLSEDGFFDSSTFPARGGFQGADYIVRGKVLDFGHFSRDTGIGALGKIAGEKLAGGFTQTKTVAHVRISVEVIDLRTGRLAMSDNSEARHEKTGTILLAGDLKTAIGAAIKLGDSKFDASMIGKASGKVLDKLAVRINGLFNMEARVLAVSPDGTVIDMGTSSGLTVGKRGKLYTLKEIKNAKGMVVWCSKTLAGDVTVTEVQPEGALVSPIPGTSPKEGDLVVFDH